MSLAQKTEAAADDVGRMPMAKAIARAGLAARGVVYCVIGALAVQIAFGSFERADKSGALQAIVRQPFGRLMLFVLAIGFAAYAASCFVKAAAGKSEGGSGRSGASGTAKRLGDVGKGVIYLGLMGSALTIALKGGGGGGGSTEKEWTARLLERDNGQLMVEALGVVLVGFGIYLLYKGLSQSFEEHLRMGEMPANARRPMSWLGTMGYAARGVIVGVMGVFFFIAALRFNPDESVGVDGALRKLAGQSYGQTILILIALGLLCFGLFSFVEARYRKVLQE